MKTKLFIFALLLGLLPVFANAQVSSNYLKYIGGQLSPSVVGLKNVELPATTTITTNNTSMTLGSLDVGPTQLPAVFGVDSDGNMNVALVGGVFSIESVDTNQPPLIGLADITGNIIGTISMSTSTGGIAVNSLATTTFDQAVYSPCFSSDGATCNVTNYWTNTGTFLVNNVGLPVASTFPFYSF